ncbi:hypothetical protein, partial [Microbacterium sp. C7(2022)]|uniref:hypothetical protein n=1 Tax=Microbacterium sp. C7(2022) TaxID=2992759 RepID=UPI00237A5EB6
MFALKKGTAPRSLWLPWPCFNRLLIALFKSTSWQRSSAVFKVTPQKGLIAPSGAKPLGFFFVSFDIQRDGAHTMYAL